MKILLDTCVISELYRANADQHVRDAVAKREPGDLFLSVITFGELQKGTELLPAGRKRSDLERWLTGLQHEFGDRVVPVDLETAHIWGELSASTRLGGRTILAADLLIAASAIRHGLRVMTRNTRDFAPSGVAVIDPWDAA